MKGKMSVALLRHSLLILLCAAPTILYSQESVTEGSRPSEQYAPGIFRLQLSEAAMPQHNRATASGPEVFAQLTSLNRLCGDWQVYKVERCYHAFRYVETARSLGLDRWFVLQLPKNVELKSAIAEFKKNKHVAEATPDWTGSLFATPNDPRFGDNWGHNNSGDFQEWKTGDGFGAHTGPMIGNNAGDDADIETAWDAFSAYGDQNIIIAIIDSGVDWDHPDLAANIWTNPDEVAGDMIDNDLNGYVDDTRGWNFVNGNNDVTNSINSHGSEVAGIASAVANNNIGVAGSAGNCTIMPLRFTTSGNIDFNLAADAICYAVDNGAHIINMSFGVFSTASDIRMEQAIDYAVLNDVLLIAATGNENEVGIAYPASNANVVAIGAASPCNERKFGHLSLGSSCDNQHWWGSNWGTSVQNAADAVDLVGPSMLPTTDNIGAYRDVFWGTSCAAPYVSGVAALILSRRPTLTPAQLRTELRNNTTDINSGSHPGWDEFIGYGLIDAGAALGTCLADVTMSYSNVHPEYQTVTQSRTVRATNTITAGGNYFIDDPGEVDMHAGQEIRLTPGFEARAGSEFHGHLMACAFPKHASDGLPEQPAANKQPASAGFAPLKVSAIPNPAEYEATIAFSLAQAGPVRLEIRNLYGALVHTIADGRILAAGRQQLVLPLQSLSSGAYLCTVQSASGIGSVQLRVLR